VPIFFGLKNLQKATSFFKKGIIFHYIYIYIYKGFAKKPQFFKKENIVSIITTIDYNFEDILNCLRIFTTLPTLGK
jgi:hypothetical protein